MTRRPTPGLLEHGDGTVAHSWLVVTIAWRLPTRVSWVRCAPLRSGRPSAVALQ